MKSINLIALIVLVLSLTASAQNPTDSTENPVQNTWRSLIESDYSIEYPPTWELQMPGLMGTSFILFSPVVSEDDQFRENVNMMVQDVSGLDIDLDAYVDISVEQIKTLITEGTIVENERISNGKTPFHKIVFTGKQGLYDLKFEQHYWVVDNKAYVVTLTCEESQFALFQDVGNRILASFRLIDQKK